MTYRIRHISIGAVMMLIAVAAFSLFYVAKANPSFFIRSNNLVCGNYTATTSPTFMSIGTATTSITFDSACASAGNADSAVLLLQMTASTTNSVIDVTYEYSQDNLDWYYSDLSSQATTTPAQNISTQQSYRLSFASTTQDLGASQANLNRILRAITVPTPTRYVKALITVPVLANGNASSSAVWAEFTAKRQAN